MAPFASDDDDKDKGYKPQEGKDDDKDKGYKPQEGKDDDKDGEPHVGNDAETRSFQNDKTQYKRKAAENPTATGKPKSSASTYTPRCKVDWETWLFDDTTVGTEGHVYNSLFTPDDGTPMITFEWGPPGYMQRQNKYRAMCTKAGRRQFFTELNKKPKTEHAEAIEELCAELDTHIKETKEAYRLRDENIRRKYGNGPNPFAPQPGNGPNPFAPQPKSSGASASSSTRKVD